MADIKKQKKSIRDKKKRDVLLSFGDKAVEFGQKHAVLIIAVIAAVVIGIFVIVIMHHTAVANEAKASDDLAAFKSEMNAARTADAALLAADKMETLRAANKGKKIYPLITFTYARSCDDAGIDRGNVELLQRSIKAYNDLLDNYPRADVTRMKDAETGENLVTRKRDNAQKALDGLKALDTEVEWGEEDLPPLEPETPGGPAPVGEGT